MSEAPPISDWLKGLEAGDAATMQQLWDAFFERLLRAAEHQLRMAPTHLVDGEDIVVSVFESIWHAAQAGRFRNVANVDELLWLLLAMTRRKCIDHIRRSRAARRGGGAAPMSISLSPKEFFTQITSDEPDPYYVTALNDQYHRILQRLADPVLQRIAVMRIEGRGLSEIAQTLGIAESTVRRKLKLIRQICQDLMKNDQ